MSIGIYIRDIRPEDAIRWMEGRLGPLVQVDMLDDVRIMHTTSGGVAVVVTPSMEDGPFLGIDVGGEKNPWTRSEQLAIPCAVELGKTVRWCDEDTNGFMEKHGDGPAVPIDWDDED